MRAFIVALALVFVSGCAGTQNPPAQAQTPKRDADLVSIGLNFTLLDRADWKLFAKFRESSQLPVTIVATHKRVAAKISIFVIRNSKEEVQALAARRASADHQRGRSTSKIMYRKSEAYEGKEMATYAATGTSEPGKVRRVMVMRFNDDRSVFVTASGSWPAELDDRMSMTFGTALSTLENVPR